MHPSHYFLRIISYEFSFNFYNVGLETKKFTSAQYCTLTDLFQVTNAVNIVQQEWFKTSSTKQSEPLMVEDYLDSIEDMSKELLNRVVNMTDVNGNTALHYSVSHGNFNVVSVLLDSKVKNILEISFFFLSQTLNTHLCYHKYIT